MTEWIKKVLRCPACGESLSTQQEAGRRLQTGLVCVKCGRHFPVIEEVPRLMVTPVEADDAAQSFGFQWRARARGRFEKDRLYGLTMPEEKAAFLNAYGISVDELKGKTLLDAGCGDGALLELIAPHAGEVVGMDINTSIAVPHQRCRHLDNVTVLQVDILKPCFARETFDFVWCEGVVVATPHPREAFRSVSRLVRPGGKLYVWVYPSYRLSVYQRARDLLIAAHRLPRPLLFSLCYLLAVGLSPLLQLTGRPRSLRTVAFELFDNLSPQYQWRYTVDEIRGWFHEEGFNDLRVIGHIGISGTRAT